MMTGLSEIRDSLLHLIFPHICSGCGNDIVSEESSLCMRCMHAMPETGFENYSDNPIEKIFWGRLPLVAATSQFYFTKESLIQHLMHQFKYKHNKELGLQLGRIMGERLLSSKRFPVDALVPLPLYAAREKKRGYNQSAVLCEGIAAVMNVPVLKNVVIRPQQTETQTLKGRVQRWQNMEGKFTLTDPSLIHQKHILLVDDVITTGATLEACAAILLQANDVQLSIATLCYAAQ